jgi:hypothetical protein
LDVLELLLGVVLAHKAGKTKGEDGSDQFLSIVDATNVLQFLLKVLQFSLQTGNSGLELVHEIFNFSFKGVTGLLACFSKLGELTNNISALLN